MSAELRPFTASEWRRILWTAWRSDRALLRRMRRALDEPRPTALEVWHAAGLYRRACRLMLARAVRYTWWGLACSPRRCARRDEDVDG